MIGLDVQAGVQIMVVLINIGLIILIPLALYFIIKLAAKNALREFYLEIKDEIRKVADKES